MVKPLNNNIMDWKRHKTNLAQRGTSNVWQPHLTTAQLTTFYPSGRRRSKKDTRHLNFEQLSRKQRKTFLQQIRAGL